jgi:hypothetical protein
VCVDVQDSATSYKDEELMSKVLAPSTYRVEFNHFLSATDDVYLTACYPLMLELAIMPIRTMEERYRTYTTRPNVCNVEHGSFPKLDFGDAQTFPYSYDSATDINGPTYHVRSQSIGQDKYTTNFVHAWNFTLPAVRHKAMLPFLLYCNKELIQNAGHRRTFWSCQHVPLHC